MIKLTPYEDWLSYCIRESVSGEAWLLGVRAIEAADKYTAEIAKLTKLAGTSQAHVTALLKSLRG